MPYIHSIDYLDDQGVKMKNLIAKIKKGKYPLIYIGCLFWCILFYVFLFVAGEFVLNFFSGD